MKSFYSFSGVSAALFTVLLNSSLTFAAQSEANPLQWQRIGEAIDHASTSVNQQSKEMTTLSTSGNGSSQADFYYSMPKPAIGVAAADYTGSMYLVESSASYLLDNKFNPAGSSHFSVDANKIKSLFPNIASGSEYRLIFNNSWLQNSESGFFGLDFAGTQSKTENPLQWQRIGEDIDHASTSVNQQSKEMTTLSTSGNGSSQADFYYSMPKPAIGVAAADFTGSIYLVESSASYLLDNKFNPAGCSQFTVDAKQLKSLFPNIASGSEYRLIFNNSWLQNSESGLFGLDFAGTQSKTENPLQWQRIGEAIDHASTSVNQQSKEMTTLSTSGNGPSQADFYYSMPKPAIGVAAADYTGSMYLVESSASYLLDNNFNPAGSSQFSIDANKLKSLFPDIASGSEYRLIFNNSWLQDSESGLFGLDFGSGSGSYVGDLSNVLKDINSIKLGNSASVLSFNIILVLAIVSSVFILNF